MLCLVGGAANAEENRRVLVLYEQGGAATVITLIDREIWKVLEKQTTYHVDLYVGCMETNLFVGPVSQREIRYWYPQKYRDQLDVIVAVGGTPIHFMIDAHEKNFPGLPIVISGTGENWSSRTELDSQFTASWMNPNPVRTLDVALQLQPDPRNVIVVNRVVPLHRSLEDSFRNSLGVYENRLKFNYLSGLPMSSLLPRLRQAPKHTVVLFGAINRDATGQRLISTTQSLPAVIGASNAPDFVLDDVSVGRGSGGGLPNQLCLARPCRRGRRHEDSWRAKTSKHAYHEGREPLFV
jgi:hypothetical protein